MCVFLRQIMGIALILTHKTHGLTGNKGFKMKSWKICVIYLFPKRRSRGFTWKCPQFKNRRKMQESSSSPECSGNPFCCAARKRLERKAGCSVNRKRKPSAPKNKKRLEISNLCSILQLFFTFR